MPQFIYMFYMQNSITPIEHSFSMLYIVYIALDYASEYKNRGINYY